MTTRKRVALALGGGGARGYAHIGVIQVLEEQGYEVVGVAGTSMGALVGGVHAAGKLDEYADWVGSLRTRDVLRLLDPSIRSAGTIKGDRVMARVSELLDGVRIEDLPIPFTSVATDLLARKEVWFTEGPVDMAIRASIALPTFLPPVVLNGRVLADGVLTNPVPIAPLSMLDVDMTVAVNLSGASSTQHLTARSESSDPRPVAEWQERLRRTASQVFDNETGRRLTTWLSTRRDDAHEDPAEQDEPEHGPAHDVAPEPHAPGFEDLPGAIGMLDVVELSLDALQSVVTRYRLASYPPDVMITLPKSICRTLDFHRGAEMIEVGREYAARALERHADEGSHPDHDLSQS